VAFAVLTCKMDVVDADAVVDSIVVGVVAAAMQLGDPKQIAGRPYRKLASINLMPSLVRGGEVSLWLKYGMVVIRIPAATVPSARFAPLL